MSYFNFVKTGYIEDIQRLDRNSQYPALLCIVPKIKAKQRTYTFPYDKMDLTFYCGDLYDVKTEDEFEKYDDVIDLFNQFILAMAADAKFEITGIDAIDTDLVPEGVTKDFSRWIKCNVSIKFFKDSV